MSGWIGVDLDGTLAVYDGWKGAEHIGDPIPQMVSRVTTWLYEGKEVRIFTARAADQGRAGMTKDQVLKTIEDWCSKHLGQALPITNIKDFGMIELWDDRAIQVEMNTGRRVDGK